MDGSALLCPEPRAMAQVKACSLLGNVWSQQQVKYVTASQSREQHCLLMVPELDQVLFILQLQPDCFCFAL